MCSKRILLESHGLGDPKRGQAMMIHGDGYKVRVFHPRRASWTEGGPWSGLKQNDDRGSLRTRLPVRVLLWTGKSWGRSRRSTLVGASLLRNSMASRWRGKGGKRERDSILISDPMGLYGLDLRVQIFEFKVFKKIYPVFDKNISIVTCETGDLTHFRATFTSMY